MLKVTKISYIFFTTILFFSALVLKQVHAEDKSNELITFIANSETMGDGINPSTMDYFQQTQYPQLSLIIQALKKLNKTVEVIDWQAPNIDWSKKNKLILGPVWGYTRDIPKFIDWLDMLDRNQIEIVNSAKFLKWNIKKNYLLDLKNNHINIPDTLIIEPDSKITLEEAIALFQTNYGYSSDLIIKGNIDAGAFGYLRLQKTTSDNALNHFDVLLKENKGVVIQNFIPQIYQKGELAFVFLKGKISHFFLKVPKYNEERVQPFYGGRSFHMSEYTISNCLEYIKSDFRFDLQLTESEIKNALVESHEIYSKLLMTLDKLNISHPVYLRMDGVVVNSNFIVMELEGIEPYLEMQEALKNASTDKIIDSYVNTLILERDFNP